MNGVVALAPEGTSNGWRGEEVWAYDVASTGIVGDHAVGTAYESRVWKELPDGTFAVITEIYYVEALDDRPGEFFVTGRYELMHCADRVSPGSTEIWCDYQYDTDVDAFIRTSLEGAEAVCRRLATTDYRWAWQWNGEHR